MDGPLRLLCLDVDGTLVRTRSGNVNRIAFAGRAPEQDWYWIDGVREKIAALRAADPGLRLAIATNQAGAAYGFHDRERMQAEIDAVARELGDDVFVTIAWGKTGDPMRKPAPGALIAAMQHFGVSAERTTHVGDRDDDLNAARAAGCHFVWAEDFFKSVEPRRLGVA